MLIGGGLTRVAKMVVRFEVLYSLVKRGKLKGSG